MKGEELEKREGVCLLGFKLFYNDMVNSSGKPIWFFKFL